MAKYLIEGNYQGERIKGLLNEGGSKRREAASAATESVGDTLDCMDVAFGESDIYGIGSDDQITVVPSAGQLGRPFLKRHCTSVFGQGE